MIAPAETPWKRTLYGIIFETRTPAGRAFDLVLIAVILASVVVVMLESVAGFRDRYGTMLFGAEWAFTALFTIEYLVRLSIVDRPKRYAFSFFGIVDLLAVLPTYLSLFVPGAQVLLVIRLLRILRLFHIFEATRAVAATQLLLGALRSSRYPIAIFLATLSTVVVLLGALMYLVEGEAGGFTSIPMGVYWAVVTLTTLGYGDVVPVTALGRGLTTGIVVLGYWVLAVPVGIMSMAIANAAYRDDQNGDEAADAEGDSGVRQSCDQCGLGDHEPDSVYCRRCGEALD